MRNIIWIPGLFSGFVAIGRYRKWLTDINVLFILILQTAALVRRALAEVCTVPVLYLYLCLQPLTLGQVGLLVDHLLSSNKIFRIQCTAVRLPMFVQPFLETISTFALLSVARSSSARLLYIMLLLQADTRATPCSERAAGRSASSQPVCAGQVNRR